MNENIQILEGNITRKFSPIDKLEVDTTTEGETSIWVPQDDHKTGVLYASANGIYIASEDGYDSYSEVVVRVEERNENGEYIDESGENWVDIDYGGDIDNDGDIDFDDFAEIGIWDEDTLSEYANDIEAFDELFNDDETWEDEEVEPLTGDELEDMTDSIAGIDPDTGETYEYSTDLDGNLNVECLPSAIHIVVPPRKLKYEEGETLDFTGIHVYLMDGNNKRYTDSNYPTGEIPFEELIFPVTVAESGGQGRSSATIDDQSFIAPNVIPIPLPLNGSLVYGTPENPEQRYTITSSSRAYLILEESTDSVEGLIITVGDGMYHEKYENFDNHNRDWEREVTVPVNGSTLISNTPFGFRRIFSLHKSVIGTQYYVTGAVAKIVEGDSDFKKKLATIIIDGTIIQTGVEIPVEWIRTDGEILEDTFEIEVGEGGEPDPPQPDPFAGSADVSWGGHHYNINRRLVPPVQYSNGYCWRQQAGEYIVEYTVEQATKFGWLILIR